MVNGNALTSKAIKAARLKRGWTQEQLARHLKVGQQTISRWESGKTVPNRKARHLLWTFIGDTPATATSSTTAGTATRPLLPALPLHLLAPETFEAFAAEWIQLRHPGADVNRQGSQGHAQEGIDISARLPDGTVFDYQCKRHKRFGPQQVDEAVLANTRSADHHYILLAREVASPGARNAIGGHPHWSLLDGQDISRLIRTELPSEGAARLVDAFFSGGSFREDFLGVRDLGPWMTPEEFFLPFDRRDQALSHGWTFVGRDRELGLVMENLTRSSSTAVVLCGRGGSGKTRLLKTVAEQSESEEPGYAVRFLSTTTTVDARDFERFPRGKAILVIDDAHDRADIGSILDGLVRLRPRARVIVATRPYGLPRILAELRRFNLTGFDDAPVVEIQDLDQAHASSLASEVLEEHHASPHVAPRIAELTADCPLLTVVAAGLVARDQVSPTLISDKEAFREMMLGAFADAITQGIAGTGGENSREILELISLLQPLIPDSTSFLEVAGRMTGLSEDRVLRSVKLLQDAGLLLRRGRLVRVAPDLLGDFIVAEAAYDRLAGRSTGYADRVFTLAPDDLVENLLVNVSRLDWQVSGARGLQTNLLDRIWAGLVQRFRGRGILGREALLKTMRRVSVYQPERVLSLVQLAIDEPTDRLEEDYSRLFTDFRIDYSSVLGGLPELLRGVAYNLPFVQEAAQVLWELGRNDDRPTNSHPDHPLRVLEDLAAYEQGKPLSYNERVADAAIQWLDHPRVGSFVHSPFEVLEPLLATEGTHVASKGYLVELTPYVVRPDVVRPLRQKATNAAFAAVGHSDIAVGAAAIRFLREALRQPHGLFGEKVDEEEAAGWIPDILQVLQGLERLVRTGSLDPVLLDQIDSAVSWQASHGREPLRSAAQRVTQALPDSLSYRLTAAMTLDWIRAARHGADDFADAEANLQSRREEVADQLLDEFSVDEIVNLLGERLRVFERARVKASSSPGQFVWTVCSKSPDVADALAAEVLREPTSPLAAEFSTILGTIRRRDPEAALRIARHGLESGADTVVQAISKSYGWGLRGGEPPSNDEIDLLIRLTHVSDRNVLAAIAHATPEVMKVNPAAAVELLLAILRASEGDVLGDVFAQFGRHGELSIDDLGEEHLSEIEDHLIKAPRIGDYHVGEFLGELSLRNPMRATELLIRRIENHDGDGRPSYRSLPFRWEEGAPLRVRETPRFWDVLAQVRDWMRKQNPRLRHRGAELFGALAGGFDKGVISFLQETSHSGDPVDVEIVATILSEAASGVIRQNPAFIQDLLEEAWRIDLKTYKRVKNALHRAASSGIRSGVPGEPFPEDVEQREWAREMAASVAEGSAAHQFYDELRRMAEESIRMNLERDAEDLMLDS